MDDRVRSVLGNAGLENVTLLAIEDIALKDSGIRTARGNRSTVEFYFTSKPFLCAQLFAVHPEIDLLTYLDADMYFLGDPKTIIREMDGWSVGLTPHRFPQHLKTREQYGLYNAGFICFRRDDAGLACLDWWRNSCLDWCHDYVHQGRFADQGYLSDMPVRFPKVRIIANKGINAAPWNISQFRVANHADHVMVDDDRLVVYHFHGVRRICGSLYDSGCSGYRNVMSPAVRRLIYRPYLSDLVVHRLPQLTRTEDRDIRSYRTGFARFRSIVPQIWSVLHIAKSIARGIRYRSLVTPRAE